MKRSNDREGGGERNNEKKTQQQQQQQLPHELIIEILLRLPVKSLVRLKCVCKSWFSLISDPLFATSHFNLISDAPTHSQRLIIFTAMHAIETRSIDFEASLNDPTATASMNLDFLIPQSHLTLRIGGSCRGFIFFHSGPNLYLWNPSTGIHKQIPASPIVSGLKESFFTFLYGLGYDSSKDDYLVVIGSTDVSGTSIHNSTHFEFFSLRANTWNEIKGAYVSYMNYFDNPGVGTLFNGTIHWLTTCVDSFVKVVIAFDLTEWRILEIPLPDIFYSSNAPSNSKLLVFGGLMSVWAMNDDTVEIWAMKEYREYIDGVCSSWTKTFVLSINDDTPYFYPICSTSSGDIVGSDGGTGLVKYNANGLVMWDSYCDKPDQSQVALYTESLLPLPLPGDTQQA